MALLPTTPRETQAIMREQLEHLIAHVNTDCPGCKLCERYKLVRMFLLRIFK